jgi:hypothetical protein
MSSIPATQLGLTNDEIALLLHHQQAAASIAGGSSSRAASRASSQGRLLLDSSSLTALGRHFDGLMQQTQARSDYLFEQSHEEANQQHDRGGNAIAIADSVIARLREILHQIDELEVDFDRIRHIRDIITALRRRLGEMESSLPKNGVHQASISSQQQTSVVMKGDSWPSALTSVPRKSRTQLEVLDTRNDAVEGKQAAQQSEQVAGPASKETMAKLHRNANLSVHNHLTRHSGGTVAVSIGPPTDSGYASMTRGMALHTRNTQVGDRIQSTEDLHSLPQVSEGLGAAASMNLELSRNLAHEESQDIKTIYSDSASLPPFQKENYIFALARDLRHKLNLKHPTHQTSLKITDALPELLKAFAIKVGHNAPNQMRRNIMWFVYKYRK